MTFASIIIDHRNETCTATAVVGNSDTEINALEPKVREFRKKIINYLSI